MKKNKNKKLIKQIRNSVWVSSDVGVHGRSFEGVGGGWVGRRGGVGGGGGGEGGGCRERGGCGGGRDFDGGPLFRFDVHPQLPSSQRIPDRVFSDVTITPLPHSLLRLLAGCLGGRGGCLGYHLDS